MLLPPQGAQPLYWGATEEGQLLLGSHLDELEGCSPTATMFPPGELPDCACYAAVVPLPGVGRLLVSLL